MNTIPQKYIVYSVVLIAAILILIIGGLTVKPKVYRPGCAEGDKFSSTTGSVCDPKAITESNGCENGAVFNIATGDKCPVATSSPVNLFPFSDPASS